MESKIRVSGISEIQQASEKNKGYIHGTFILNSLRLEDIIESDSLVVQSKYNELHSSGELIYVYTSEKIKDLPDMLMRYVLTWEDLGEKFQEVRVRYLVFEDLLVMENPLKGELKTVSTDLPQGKASKGV